MDLVKQDVRAAWRGIFAAGFDIHLKRWVADDHNRDDEKGCVSSFILFYFILFSFQQTCDSCF